VKRLLKVPGDKQPTAKQASGQEPPGCLLRVREQRGIGRRRIAAAVTPAVRSGQVRPAPHACPACKMITTGNPGRDGPRGIGE
jgi:hypothetical protein